MVAATGNVDQQVDILDSDGLLQGGQWTAIVSGDVWAAGQAEFNARAAQYGASLDAGPVSANPPASVAGAQRLTTAAAVDLWITNWAPISAANATSPSSTSTSSSSGSGVSGTAIAAGVAGVAAIALGTFLWWRSTRTAA